jgi:hypothetical protein
MPDTGELAKRLREGGDELKHGFEWVGFSTATLAEAADLITSRARALEEAQARSNALADRLQQAWNDGIPRCLTPSDDAEHIAACPRCRIRSLLRPGWYLRDITATEAAEAQVEALTRERDEARTEGRREALREAVQVLMATAGTRLRAGWRGAINYAIDAINARLAAPKGGDHA